jgi:gag-polyprotein putative aspartyl protease
MDRLAQTFCRAFDLSLMAALVAGCGTASEECRALQSVVEAREQYDIVQQSRDLDEDALRQCGLPHSSGGGPPFQQTQLSPPVHGPEEVPIEKRGDTYRVPVRINDTITLPFLLDTGASDLAIPADVALTLVRAGALASGDFIGKDRYTLANGSEEVREQVVIREVQVGDYAVRNVTATISPPQGEPLLGQSFLSKFGAVTLDYKRLVLILSR